MAMVVLEKGSFDDYNNERVEKKKERGNVYFEYATPYVI